MDTSKNAIFHTHVIAGLTRNLLQTKHLTMGLRVKPSRVRKILTSSERAKSLAQGIVLRIERNPIHLALKGRHPDYALSGLDKKRATTDRALPYPIDYATLWLKNRKLQSSEHYRVKPAMTKKVFRNSLITK